MQLKTDRFLFGNRTYLETMDKSEVEKATPNNIPRKVFQLTEKIDRFCVGKVFLNFSFFDVSKESSFFIC